MPRKTPKVPTHYLCFNGDGSQAAAAAKSDTLKAAMQYVEYYHEEYPTIPGARTGLIYGTALRLNQLHQELLEMVEASLIVDITRHSLFSDYQTIDEWMDAHNIRRSAAAISRAKMLAENIIPWCQENEVFPGKSPREVEQWFMTILPEARSVVSRIGHVGHLIKKIAAEETMPQLQKVEEVQYILSRVANPKIENEELMLFARKFFWGKAFGKIHRLTGGKISVTLSLESQAQFEYLKDKRLKSFVEWEGVLPAEEDFSI